MKSITQRRIFSLLLSLAMLIGLLPALGSIASAAGSGTTEGDPRIVTTYAELSSALSSGVTYVKLGANINTKDLNDGAGYTKSIRFQTVFRNHRPMKPVLYECILYCYTLYHRYPRIA